jgi:aspartate beta-hydroxylase
MKDKYQNPTSLYLPDLETHPVWDKSRFEWSNKVEESVDRIRDELNTLLKSRDGFSIIYPKDSRSGLKTDTGAWGISWFHIYGARNEKIISKCPFTATLLDSIPTVNFAGLSLFSTMMPGTHLEPHCGTTNAKLRVNVPLIAEDSKIRVGENLYHLKEGELFIFDDSFEHEVFEDSSSPRFSLLFDVYHPGLSEDDYLKISKQINPYYSSIYQKMFAYDRKHDTSWIYKTKSNLLF